MQKWDSEIAKLADLNVLSCKFDHDENRNTKRFSFAGQNIYTSSSTEPIECRAQLKNAVLDWFSEYKLASENDVNECCQNVMDVGHFTQIVRDVSGNLGCGCIKYKSGIWNTVIITCNYQETNMEGTPIYVAGTKASACKSTNDKYPFLCNS